MDNWIILGVFAQFSFAIGLTFINQAALGDDQYFLKSNLVLLFSGVISFVFLGCNYIFSPKSFDGVNIKSAGWLALGGIFLLIVGEYFFIKGASVSSVAAISLTAMAFPVVSFLSEYLLFKFFGYKMPDLQMRHLIGFAFIVVGFAICSMD